MWCFQCGSSGHLANSLSCHARTLQCRNCKKAGHIEKVCRMPLNANTVSGVSVQACSSDVDLPLCTESAAVASDVDTYNIFTSSCVESSSYNDVALICRDEMHDVLKVVKINGWSITGLCDTGADVNVLPKHAYLVLSPTNVVIKAWGDFPLKVLGSCHCTVETGSLSTTAEFFVIDMDSVSVKPLLTYGLCRSLGLMGALAAVDKFVESDIFKGLSVEHV